MFRVPPVRQSTSAGPSKTPRTRLAHHGSILGPCAGVAVSSARAADQQPAQNLRRAIQDLGKEWELGKRLTAAVVTAYEAEPRPTRLGVANSSTRAAQRPRLIGRIE